MSIFEGKILLITGGTGSFGNAVLNRFLDTDIKEIRVFSRDEKKQDDMRHEYQAKYPEVSNKIKFYIGDIRDIQSVKNAMHGVDYIFHAAALKQVPSCEFFPIEAVKTNVLGTENVLTAAVDVKNAMHGVDYIFHAAALKQVPSCEFFPIEAVKTNVLGTENVLTAAVEAGAKKIICLSTDKAAYPVNAMGTSKAMMEKVIVAKARTVSPDKTSICCTRYGNVLCSRGSVIPLWIEQIKAGNPITITEPSMTRFVSPDKTSICCTRYGNVLCSRGSVIPLWIEQIKAGNPITITEPSMTRFVMSLEEAVELVVFAFQNAESGDIMVQKAPACTIEVLAQAVKELFHSEEEIKIIGIRHGEKMYETLLTNEECANAIDMGNFYRVPCDKRDLNYDKYFKDGDVERNKLTEFNSSNTDLWNVEQVKEKLRSLAYVRKELELWGKECD